MNNKKAMNIITWFGHVHNMDSHVLSIWTSSIWYRGTNGNISTIRLVVSSNDQRIF